MKGVIIRKLHSRAGESIAETLIALLIASLALLMLAGAISSAARVVTTSKQAMDEYYAADAAIAQHSAPSDNENVASDSVSLTLSGNGLSVSYSGTYYENSRFGTNPVMLYTVVSEEVATP